MTRYPQIHRVSVQQRNETKYKELGVGIGHSSTTRFHSNQLVYSSGNGLGTPLTTSEHNIEWSDPIQDQLPDHSPGIVLKLVHDVGGELWLGVFIHSQQRLEMWHGG